MKIQTLVVTTKQEDYSLFRRMNIQTDAIIGNQCDRNEIKDFEENGCRVKWFSLQERGVGLNRNTVMMRSDADICVLADDDMIFHDGYPKVVAELFEQHADADLLVFNIDEKVPTRFKNTKVVTINRSNYGKYGAARLAFRRESVQMAGISFHLMFGGGAPYSSGEDSIFLYDCLKHKLKIKAVPVSIALLQEERESTWFTGYNDKYFFDKGVLYAILYKKAARIFALYHCLRQRKRFASYGWKNAFCKMCEGIRSNRK